MIISNDLTLKKEQDLKQQLKQQQDETDEGDDDNELLESKFKQTATNSIETEDTEVITEESASTSTSPDLIEHDSNEQIINDEEEEEEDNDDNINSNNNNDENIEIDCNSDEKKSIMMNTVN